MKIVRRDEIESIHSVTIAGKSHNLGTVKVFNSHGELAEFLSEEPGVAFSWVHLSSGEELLPHVHQEPSLILVCDGSGFVCGEMNEPLIAGDAVLVSSGNVHGFRGGEEGFWGLSIQFNRTSLYENTDKPRVSFCKDEQLSRDDQNIVALNEKYLLKYSESKLIQLLSDPRVELVETKERLLGCLSVWSDAFQDLLHLRVANTRDKLHKQAAIDHLREEQGHNVNLRQQSLITIPEIWDATIELAISWFREQMSGATDEIKTLIMHLVIEASGEIFHAAAANVFRDMNHFQEHGEDDGHHVDIGLTLLRTSNTVPTVDAITALSRAWAVMLMLCDRMATIAIGTSDSGHTYLRIDEGLEILA